MIDLARAAAELNAAIWRGTGERVTLYSLRAVSQQIGVPRTTLRRWLNGEQGEAGRLSHFPRFVEDSGASYFTAEMVEELRRICRGGLAIGSMKSNDEASQSD